MSTGLLVFIRDVTDRRVPVQVDALGHVRDLYRAYAKATGDPRGVLSAGGSVLASGRLLADAGVCSQMELMFEPAVPWKPDCNAALKEAVRLLSEENWIVTEEIANFLRKNQGSGEKPPGVFDIESWDTSLITDTSRLFENSSFNEDIRGWDVSSVTDMSHMFGGASAFNQDLSSWRPCSVEDLSGMFYQATSFDQDLSAWAPHLENATDMSCMFCRAKSFNQDLSAWAPSLGLVVDMDSMFEEASSFNQDLSAWGPELMSVQVMEKMFVGSAFQQDLSSWRPTLQWSKPRGWEALFFTYSSGFETNSGRPSLSSCRDPCVETP